MMAFYPAPINSTTFAVKPP